MVKISTLFVVGAAITQQAFGYIWPMPTNFTSGNQNLIFKDSCLSVTVTGNESDILTRAIGRYSNLIQKESFTPPTEYNAGPIDSSGSVKDLTINVATNSTDLNLETDESYTLTVGADGSAVLKSQTVYGAIRGLESFSQLFTVNNGNKYIRNVPISISDAPFFNHRGLMLDTARNFYPVDVLKRTLNGLSYTKINVLHWHIVDSQAWAVEAKFDPNLAAKGSYGPSMTYSQDDVKEIISFAKDRGIRVIPEFDMPGHTRSVSLSNPDIMSCVDVQPKWVDFAAQPPSGQLNIAKQGAYDFSKKVIDEFSSLFEDKVFHVGGDEVNTNCWQTDPDVIAYLAQNPSESVNSLLIKYYDFVYKTLGDNSKTGMCWHETVMNTNAVLPNDTIVQAWNGVTATYTAIVNKGYRVVASPTTNMYLDCGHGPWVSNSIGSAYYCDPYKHWGLIYVYDPYLGVTDDRRNQIIGGEAALWSEQSDENNIDRMLWPRMGSVGELYWKGPLPTSYTALQKGNALNDVSPRFNEFRFRLLARGISAEPTQPLWCIRNPGQCSRYLT
ncbi:hypothetical protein BB559_001418 [Furculomyces boomerangus]|uniref:Beta-hexosaminidase n=2 Tax=Harpellales TaxID=61421 RepID=A0A2T9Z230_9FUNG|nr:hypothetical protein BB559_001418 [Furculomyces boomerangus]PWA03604.1 hypothetical protein BB558_000273 [Smittium angustum]